MKAIILAAGIGNRLGNKSGNKPKSLLEFSGKSLLQRHIEILLSNNINEITIVIGYQDSVIKNHLADSKASINFIDNPRYKEGSIISLGCARDLLINETVFILMDADVLYDQEMIRRLVHTKNENCLLLDQDFMPGAEPVKICIDANDNIIEFRKNISEELQYEKQGESIGFFKFNNQVGKLLVERIDAYLAEEKNETPYEEAIRDLILKDTTQFAYEDVTGVPWIEIDFPEDIERAKKEVLPKLSPLKS